MVRVNGPMMSLAASGTLANTIVFSTWKGRPYVRERVIPSNPKSGGQVGRRAMFTFLTQGWAALSTVEKATWETLADQDTISPFNAYVKANMAGWHNFLAASQDEPATRTGTNSDVALQSAAWEENRIKLTTTGSILNDAWGLILYASLSGGFTPAVGNAIIINLDDSATGKDFFWTPPEVAIWYFDTQTFTDDGKLSALAGEQAASP